jgi:hypothetical protein
MGETFFEGIQVSIVLRYVLLEMVSTISALDVIVIVMWVRQWLNLGDL